MKGGKALSRSPQGGAMVQLHSCLRADLLPPLEPGRAAEHVKQHQQCPTHGLFGA